MMGRGDVFVIFKAKERFDAMGIMFYPKESISRDREKRAKMQ